MRTDGEQQHAHSPEMAGKSSHLAAGTEKTRKNRTCCTGLLAHVDAGKTTLAEAILYQTGRIRALGRVDHQDAYLDNFALERARGITIFSKQAQVVLDGQMAGTGGRRPADTRSDSPLRSGEGYLTNPGGGRVVEAGFRTEPLTLTILDTPGHVDFSAEMERTLQVLDYAILVISAPDGVQSHVDTLWRLLARYEIPVFLFINKMDLPGTDREALMAHLSAKLDERCVDFSGLKYQAEQVQREAKFQEDLAMCDDRLLEIYASGETIGTDEIRHAIAARHVFPCYFGSALRLEGAEELLDGIYSYSLEKEYSDVFGARVYKISRDAQGNRLTHMKITGGMLRVKDLLAGEKVNQIRIPSGGTFGMAQEADAGTICAVTGLEHTRVGQGLGEESEAEMPLLEPVLSYRIELPEGTDVHQAFRQMKQLEEEEPQLHITWVSAVRLGGNAADAGQTISKNSEIHAQLMGEVQTEILQDLIRERFGLKVKFGQGSIVYRETIAEPVVGMGHFEPLRHYAEVHLLMEPAERGSGLQFESACSTDDLDLNWQRLVLTHLEEKQHLGVLTGSEITDMKITLVAGRAHQKHTEGGDFRQATCRAVRQGLCRAHSILLEPVYLFRMEVPAESVGRALSDIQRMHGTAGAPVFLDAPGSSAWSSSGKEQVFSNGQAISKERATQNGQAVSKEQKSLREQDFRKEQDPLPGRGQKSGTDDGEKRAGSGQGQAGMMEITGTAPVITMRGYQSELLAYTKGRGRLSCRLKGYEACHNAEEVIASRGYDPLLDADNPCGSVFCAHGAGFAVSWEDVPEYVHIADTDRYAADAAKAADRKASADRYAADKSAGAGTEAVGGNGPFASQGQRSGPSAENRMQGQRSGPSAENRVQGQRGVPPAKKAAAVTSVADEELRAIFERTYGTAKWEGRRPADGKYADTGAGPGSRWAGYEASRTTRPSGASSEASAEGSEAKEAEARRAKRKGNASEPLEECLLVDGYNIIFAWDDLKELAKTSLESARTRLLDLMCNYQGYKDNYLIVVFDAYRVAGHQTEVSRYHNIHVVYTKEAETADQYIEKTARQIRRRYHVTVATSDALEQIIIFGAGAARLSARGLRDELEQMQKDLRENYLGVTPKGAKPGLLDGQEDLKGQVPAESE
ncbi:MAG: TetM/TetW/TetO/TetS family tetracycline resistance ribosomal protection protein [Lachnospiraceae bacterium]|nr:TetM/TetW/TetO/TetS family tetracycline resistance ribosomal protection protein [Lachnospiraceae bacterium]